MEIETASKSSTFFKRSERKYCINQQVVYPFLCNVILNIVK